MNGNRKPLPLCLTIKRVDGWEIIEFDRARRVRVRVLDRSGRSEDAFAQHFHDLKRGPDDLCVFHFSLGGDAGVFEVVDDLIANAFDLPTCVVTAEYEEGFAYGAREHLGASHAADQILDPVLAAHSHLIPRSEWLAIKGRHAVANLTIIQQQTAEGLSK